MKTYTYPGSGLVIRENFSEWAAKYTKETPAKLAQVVKKSAFVIQGNAALGAPVDTGALKNSIGANEGKNALNWEISDSVEYGIFQELGTSRGVTAKHFLGGAAECEADKFFDAVLKAMQP